MSESSESSRSFAQVHASPVATQAVRRPLRSRHLAPLVLASVLCLGTAAHGAVVWPTSSKWHTIDQGGSHITDSNGPAASRLDIRGDSTYSAGFVVWDDRTSNDNLMFRFRLEADPNSNLNRVWQVLIDSDGDTGVDWVLQLDERTDNQVELVATTTEGARYRDVRLSTTNTWSDNTGAYWQTLIVDDGSNFSGAGNNDYFLDVAIPRSQFQSATGKGITDTFRVALTTSGQHDRINQDYPFNFNRNASVVTGWSDAFSADQVRVPEPGTWALFGLGALLLARRVREGRRSRSTARS